MRWPQRDLSGQLAFTDTGTVWATWRISKPQSYGMRPIKDKTTVKDLHRMLVRSIEGEALMLGLTVALDPVAVVQRQIEGLDLEACPGVAEEAEANLDRLADMDLGERAYYLSVPLANRGTQRWRTYGSAGMGMVKDLAGLPRTHPSQVEIEARMAQAADVQRLIPRAFGAEPVSVAEQLWIAAHGQRRGIRDLPPPVTRSEQDEYVTVSGCAIPEPILDEGAKSDLSDKKFNPFTRRVLKITDPRAVDLGQDPSYQALLTVPDTPAGGLAWPGSEIFSRLDDWGADIDWAMRLSVRGRDTVMRANRKAARELADQYDQRENETTTGQHELDLAGDLLTDYTAIFANDRLEVEVEHTIILAVPGVDAADTMERADAVAAVMAEHDFKVERPAGQVDLWWAMQPGVPTSRIVHDYALVTNSDNFAKLVPYCTERLGGDRGHVTAVNRASARASIVHLDAGGYAELDKSGSLALCGELGSGKSYGMKTITGNIVDEGGQLLAIDKSNEGEWAKFAASLVDPVIVDPMDPRWSMDPLRCIGGTEGSGTALTFLVQLLGVSPQDSEGDTLSAVLDTDYLREHSLTGLGAVATHLRSKACQLEHARKLGERMGRAAKTDMGQLVFNDELAPVDGTADAIVWRTHTTEQPTREELSTEHRFRQMSMAKVWGRAYYHLIVATARRWAFADVTRASALVCDEAYDIFSNDENGRHLEHFARQGRRPKALLVVGSHNPEVDFGSETLRALIPTRVVLRQTDEDLARVSARYLGFREDDPQFEWIVEELRFNTAPAVADQGVAPERRGECWIRDAFGGVGPARLLAPARPERAAAVSSTPPKARSRQGAGT